MIWVTTGLGSRDGWRGEESGRDYLESYGGVMRLLSRKLDTKSLNDASYLVSEISAEQAESNYGKNNRN
jgi:hypothetical protein